MVIALHVTDRHFAGQRAEDVEIGAELGARAIGIAIFAKTIDCRVVDAGVFADLDERLEAGIDLVAKAQDAGILVEIAGIVAHAFAVGELRVLIHRTIGGAFERKVEAAELGTDYDYSNCNHPDFDQLEDDFNLAKANFDKLKKFLQTLPKSISMNDENTGEVVTINPAIKSSTSGYKITI